MPVQRALGAEPPGQGHGGGAGAAADVEHTTADIGIGHGVDESALERPEQLVEHVLELDPAVPPRPFQWAFSPVRCSMGHRLRSGNGCAIWKRLPDGIAHHRPAVAVRRVERRLDDLGTGGDGPLERRIGIGDVHVEEGREGLPLASGREHDARVADGRSRWGDLPRRRRWRRTPHGRSWTAAATSPVTMRGVTVR